MSSFAYNRLVGVAFAIAAEAHKGVLCKDGTAYITHPARMALRCTDPIDQMVAILHDVVEDTDCQLSDLVDAGMPPMVVSAVDALSKRDGEDYEDFIERIALNPIATRVKLLDLEDNINLLRLPVVGGFDLQRAAKYHKAWLRLRAVQEAAKQ